MIRPGAGGRPRLLIWIDAEQAVLARWDGEASLERIDPDVPPHHASTGHVRFDPRIRHGGGGVPTDHVERDRAEHVRRYLAEVAERVGPEDEVEILGPGSLREQLARLLRAADLEHGRHRDVSTLASGPLTDRQLIAHLRDRIGDPAPRRRARCWG